MSRTRSAVARRLARVPRCGRCERRAAEHVLVVPPMGEHDGYELLSCEDCWPALRMAAETLGGTVFGCECGECSG